MSDPRPPALGLFDGVLERGAVRDAVSDRAWLQAMLDVEAALARAEAGAGLFPVEEAEAIARACRAEAFDISSLGQAASLGGNPVPALVRALVAAVPGPASAHVHRGATSQDVVDTAAMLVTRRALEPLLRDLEGAADAAAALARRHRSTPMVGRTLLQQALPITFGLKAAGWLSGLDQAAEGLEAIRRNRLAVQLGGAAGTLASLGDAGPAVVDALGAALDLPAPLLPWHTVRARVADIAGALGTAAGVLGKPARDVALMAQTEVGEAREAASKSERRAGRGGSSALPHKNNPVAAVSAVACAMRAPGLVSTLLAAMMHEHERAAGAWHAEWRPLGDLLVTVGSAAAWLRDCLEHLEVDPARMRANLAATGGLLLAERVTSALGPHLGHPAARDLVAEACDESVATARSLADVLAGLSSVRAHLTATDIAALLDPVSYLGSSELFVDRALGAHDARRSIGAQAADHGPGASDPRTGPRRRPGPGKAGGG